MSAQPPKTPPTARERTQNFLLYGFGLSLLLHLIVVPFIRPEKTSQDTEKVETVRVDKMPTPPPTPKPTPKPTPTPTPPPQHTPPPLHTPEPVKPKIIKIQTLKTHAKSGGPSEQANTHTTGSTSGVPDGSPTGAPSGTPNTAPPGPPPTPIPTPTPKPPTPTPLSCAVPNANARTVSAAQPETPSLAQQQGITGEVVVRVSLDENSNLLSATVAKSPSPLLNNAALQAARQSKFITQIVNCKPIADVYNFIVEFQSQ